MISLLQSSYKEAMNIFDPDKMPAGNGVDRSSREYHEHEAEKDRAVAGSLGAIAILTAASYLIPKAVSMVSEKLGGGKKRSDKNEKKNRESE